MTIKKQRGEFNRGESVKAHSMRTIPDILIVPKILSDVGKDKELMRDIRRVERKLKLEKGSLLPMLIRHNPVNKLD